jgi:UDP-GlcNAc:undecaprenyl-phosphate GlcNAc-1-phosphate transferase
MTVTESYILSFFMALAISAGCTPLVRKTAIRFHVLDHPINQVKTHTEPVPYLGGLAVFSSFIITLIVLRLTTNFPTGTLRALRGIFIGGVLIVILGMLDDLHIRGIHFTIKFFIQLIGACVLLAFDIRIKFIGNPIIATIFTVLWVVGITNAFNLIDIMDGLSSSIAVIASLGFLLISIPTDMLYVNFASIAIMAASLGFIPYNLSKRYRIFLGDTGSLFIGFVLSALALGTSFTTVNRISVFAPILVLGIPIYETILLIYHRLKKGKSPFMGSKDHFALRMEKLGLSRRFILLITVCAAFILSGIAFVSTRIPDIPAIGLYVLVAILFIFVSLWLGKVEVD